MKIIKIIFLLILLIPSIIYAGKKIIINGVLFEYTDEKNIIEQCVNCNTDIIFDIKQLSCGDRICFTCLDKLNKKIASNLQIECPSEACRQFLDLVESNSELESFTDKALTKQIKQQITFMCKNDSCSWNGNAEECNIHAANCEYKLISCSWPQCNYQVHDKHTMEKHQQSIDSHKLLIADAMPLLLKMLQAYQTVYSATDSQTENSCPDLIQLFQNLKIASCTNTGATGHSTGLTNEVTQQIAVLQKKTTAQLNTQNIKIATSEALVQQLKETVDKYEQRLNDAEFRLSLTENVTHDGTMLWKIPNFAEQKQNAISGKYTSIFSLPFNSSRYGYKMCLRLYILGDGDAKNKYMSLFLVIMKGEFDNILQWPFNHQVTLKLFNQTGGNNIQEKFQPDPSMLSFQKPKSDMNVAVGIHCFISQEELNSGGYILDNTIFIAVSVYPTK